MLIINKYINLKHFYFSNYKSSSKINYTFMQKFGLKAKYYFILYTVAGKQDSPIIFGIFKIAKPDVLANLFIGS